MLGNVDLGWPRLQVQIVCRTAALEYITGTIALSPKRSGFRSGFSRCQSDDTSNLAPRPVMTRGHISFTDSPLSQDTRHQRDWH
jgi:hypothetical protein